MSLSAGRFLCGGSGDFEEAILLNLESPPVPSHMNLSSLCPPPLSPIPHPNMLWSMGSCRIDSGYLVHDSVQCGCQWGTPVSNREGPQLLEWERNTAHQILTAGREVWTYIGDGQRGADQGSGKERLKERALGIDLQECVTLWVPRERSGDRPAGVRYALGAQTTSLGKEPHRAPLSHC